MKALVCVSRCKDSEAKLSTLFCALAHKTKLLTFSTAVFNRKKLCRCHFHKQTNSSEAHKGHKKCAVVFMKCGHSEEDDNAMDTYA